MTLEENCNPVKGRTLCYVGDGRNNVARSLMVICSKLGVHFTVITPPELNPDDALRKLCAPLAAASGAKITVTADTSAVTGANALYTDVWVSMGEENKKEERVRLLSPYQVNQALMDKTG
jgi:ornithine carbamoyltransferase